MTHKLSEIRREYAQKALSCKEIHSDPIEQFEQWFDEAYTSKIPDPTAMVLSTVNREFQVSSRIVLLKGIEQNGFVFYTNYNSRKATDLAASPNASLLFYWAELERQVRIEGHVEQLSRQRSDEYFASRPEGSKLAAWASNQSQVIPDRRHLEDQIKAFEQKFQNKPIYRPSFWGGYILYPASLEFWQGRPNRLHDRIQFILEENQWKPRRLAP